MGIFDKLRENIGKTVTLYFYNSGNVFIIKDALKDVDDYTCVTIGNIKYPFINKVSGIGTISTDKEVLYDNPVINEAYYCISNDDLEYYKKESFGEDYQDKKRAYSLNKHTVQPKNSKEDIN